jgi:hypothetical protein
MKGTFGKHVSLNSKNVAAGNAVVGALVHMRGASLCADVDYELLAQQALNRLSSRLNGLGLDLDLSSTDHVARLICTMLQDSNTYLLLESAGRSITTVNMVGVPPTNKPIGAGYVWPGSRNSEHVHVDNIRALGA